mgnify:CR=1 FL=1
MANDADNKQIVPLRELLASTLEAAIEADMTTMRRYFDNVCEIAFQDYDKEKQNATQLRTLAFNYSVNEGAQQLRVPVLSLVPLPMLQMKDINFSMNAELMGLRGDTESTSPQLYVSIAPKTSSSEDEASQESTTKCSIKIEMKMEQADMPGGMARLLQIVNNMNLK